MPWKKIKQKKDYNEFLRWEKLLFIHVERFIDEAQIKEGSGEIYQVERLAN